MIWQVVETGLTSNDGIDPGMVGRFLTRLQALIVSKDVVDDALREIDRTHPDPRHSDTQSMLRL